MKVLIKYTIIFDPSEAWSKISEFEGDFAKFFNDRGLEVEVVQPPNQVREDDKILLLTKKEIIVEEEKTPTPKQVKRQLIAKRDVKGKYE